MRLAHAHAGSRRRRRLHLRLDYGPSSASADCQPPHDLISIIKVPHADPTRPRRRDAGPVPRGAATPLPTPPAATTSPSTRARTSPPARAWVTASSSTSPTRAPVGHRDGARHRTSRSGTRRRSTATRPRSCSPTSSAAARRHLQRGDRPEPRRRRDLRPVGRQRSSTSVATTRSRAPEHHRELRRPQRLDDPGRRAGTSWCRPGTRAVSPCGSSPTPQPEGDRLLRAWPAGRHARWPWSAYYYNGYVYARTSRRASTS